MYVFYWAEKEFQCVDNTLICIGNSRCSREREREMRTTCHKIHRNQKKNKDVPAEMLWQHLLSDFTKKLNKIKGVQCPYSLLKYKLRPRYLKLHPDTLFDSHCMQNQELHKPVVLTAALWRQLLRWPWVLSGQDIKISPPVT